MKTFLVAAFTLIGSTAFAQQVAVEAGQLGKSTVKLHVQPFLSAEELATLRLVKSNEQALQVFLGAGEGAGKGFAAMAVQPEEGFIRNGQPVKSAVALAGLASPKEAAEAAIAGCQAAAKAKAPCVLVLEVAAE